MKTRGKYAIGMAIVALQFWTACVQATPLKFPRRAVDGTAVNLEPLFHWWTNHSAARPLKAWVHVNGSVVGTNGFGWILEARVEQSGMRKAPESSSPTSQRILLKHPPAQDLANFIQLTNQLAALTTQRGRVFQEEGQAHARATSATTRGRARTVMAAENRQIEQHDKNAVKTLDQEIAGIRAKLAAFPNPSRYEVDCFALDTGRDQEKLAAFDHGSPLQ